jgi:XTP/dITP diphosphohydrolase
MLPGTPHDGGTIDCMTQQVQPGQPLDSSHPKLEELIAVLAQLRAPGGCAWDAEQTHESLVRYLVEETYELIDAIESGDRNEMIEELGDVLYQVIFHSDIASQTPGEEFTLEDVAAHMTAKMIGRHPHVFGEAVAETAEEVAAAWDGYKRLEKPKRTSTLDGVPQGMPALALADKLLGKAEKVGVGSTVPAAESAESAGSADFAAEPPFADEDALGDLLLTIVSSARANGLDPERALRARLRRLQDEIRAAEASAH